MALAGSGGQNRQDVGVLKMGRQLDLFSEPGGEDLAGVLRGEDLYYHRTDGSGRSLGKKEPAHPPAAELPARRGSRRQGGLHPITKVRHSWSVWGCWGV
jgi:hypothetical protein